MTTTDAGLFGENLVREELRKITGSVISGFIRSKNICYYNKNFQIDFLVFAPRVGLVILEVKNWKGTIKASAADKWTQETGDAKNEFFNASLQCLRTSGLVLQILEKGKINKWPIRPLVVFANNNAKILTSIKESPQTDIIFKTKILDWLEKNSTDEVHYKFTEQEFQQVKSVICEYTSDYTENN